MNLPNTRPMATIWSVTTGSTLSGGVELTANTKEGTTTILVQPSAILNFTTINDGTAKHFLNCSFGTYRVNQAIGF